MSFDVDKTILAASVTNRESKHIEFKSSFDPESKGEWCEILKDIIAMINSGGGLIIFGIYDNGKPSDYDKNIILNYDSAKITDKIEKYTGESYSNFDIVEIKRGRKKFATLITKGARVPIIFTQTGSYKTETKKDKNAFFKGMLYIRRGASSSPANSKDIQKIIFDEVRRQRFDWLGNIKKIVTAPIDHKVHILPEGVNITNSASAKKIKLTNDENAKKMKLETPDIIYPHRQCDIINEFNKKSKKKINSYDIQCVKKLYDLPSKLEFLYKSKFGSTQYSDEFLQWLLSEINKDKYFFINIRKKYRIKNQKNKEL